MPPSCATGSPRWPPTSPRDPGIGARRKQIAEGFLQIAVDNMANAIKHISVERGYDVTEYTLCCFGGAGGQHACAVADALGMTRVFIHPLAGVLSAYGMGLADVRALRQRAVEAPLSAAALAERRRGIRRARAAWRATKSRRKASPPARIAVKRSLHLKYDGTDTTLEIGFDAAGRTRPAGEAARSRTLRRSSPISSSATGRNTAS